MNCTYCQKPTDAAGVKLQNPYHPKCWLAKLRDMYRAAATQEAKASIQSIANSAKAVIERAA